MATKASEIAGAITENPTLECDENFAKDSKIPTTVPNRPTKGEVEEIIDNQETPILDSRRIEISQALKISFVGIVFFVHLLKLERGLILNVSLKTKDSKALLSLSTDELTDKYR